MELKLTRISTYEVTLMLKQVPEYRPTFKTVGEYRDLMSMVNAPPPPILSPSNKATAARRKDEDDEDAFNARDVFDMDCDIVTRLNM